MSNKNFMLILMVLVAMSFFKSPLSQAQTETPRSFKIKTPNTKKQLQAEDESLEKDETSGRVNSVAPRRIQQHGLGFGIGETFLLGNYAKTGEEFDLLINAHMSEHKDNSERMRLMGLTGSVKARVVEFDNFSPYFLGGLGFYLPEAKRSVDGSNTWSDKKVTFGLNFGGGADLRLNENYAVGVMGQMHWPFAIKQDEGSDIKGYYFKLLITGMYLF